MSGLSSVPHDIRYAIRRLRNSPGFSAVAIATIALAIGANTAMFSFVNGILLGPLLHPESDRIVRVLEKVPSGGLNGISTINSPVKVSRIPAWSINENVVISVCGGKRRMTAFGSASQRPRTCRPPGAPSHPPRARTIPFAASARPSGRQVAG
jgi:hypothetical protein